MVNNVLKLVIEQTLTLNVKNVQLKSGFIAGRLNILQVTVDKSGKL